MNLQLYSLGKQINGFISKHHPVLFIAFVGLLLAGAIYYMYQVLILTNDSEIATTSVVSHFDQQTIDEIKALRDTTSGNETVTLPSPRSNPFAE
jgi:hypothetical protein